MKEVLKSYRYRIEPNAEQKILLNIYDAMIVKSNIYTSSQKHLCIIHSQNIAKELKKV